jgi:hypothetical protein
MEEGLLPVGPKNCGPCVIVHLTLATGPVCLAWLLWTGERERDNARDEMNWTWDNHINIHNQRILLLIL